MAEPVKPAQKAPAQPEAPPPVEVAPPVAEPPQPPTKAELAWKKFRKAFSGFLTTTTWLVMGLALIVLGFLEHYFRFTHHAWADLLSFLMPEVPDSLLHKLRFPYLFVSLGLFSLGKARGSIYRGYAAEVKKNKKSPQAWKLPLIGFQLFVLYAGFVYFLLVGFKQFEPINNFISLVFVLFIGLGYCLWYLITQFKSHFPSFSAWGISIGAVVLATLSYGFWAGYHQVLISLILAFYALVAALASLAITASGSQDQRGNWARMLCLILTCVFVYIVGTNAIPYGRNSMELKGLGLAVGDPIGEIGLLAYGPKVYDQKAHEKTVQKIAFSLKAKDGWFLQLIDPEHPDLKTFKLMAGEGAFHPIFIDKGKSLIMDPVKNGMRALWKVNVETGAAMILTKSGVEPLGNGAPWHEATRQFLFVTQADGIYRLNVWSAATDAVRTLMKSEHPILTPSFTFSGDQVAYADGTSGFFRTFDIMTKESDFVMSHEERSEQQKGEGPPVTDVIPAPDGFRYLYVTQVDGKASLWTVLSDGSKRKKIYVPGGTLRNISWTPDGQKIVFEERKRQLGFWTESENIRVLDANLETVENLIPPQISHKSPAVSPDGVKIAFVANQGLWYPSTATGIWVAVLR